MERAKSAAIRLRDTGQWKAQFYGHAKILQHDKSIPKITDLWESVAPIETVRGVMNFGFSAIHIKVYKGDSNAASSSAGNPADQVLAEELEAPGAPEDGYSTNSSLSREMRALGPAIENVDLSDTEEADVTVVEVEAVDVTKTSTNKPSAQ